MSTQLVSQDVVKVLALANMRHWSVRVVGHGDVPPEPFFKNGWLFKPLGADDTMPAIAVKRVQELYRVGIRPRGFVVAYQMENLLGAPVNPKEPKEPILPKVMTGLAVAVGAAVVVAVALPLLLELLKAALTLVLGVVGLVVLLTTVDPALIVVLEDGTWVEMARWHE